MNFAKGAGIGGLLLAAAYYGFEQLKPLLTPAVVSVIAIAAGLFVGGVVVGFLISWGWTQAYKRVRVPDLSTLDKATADIWRQRIYLRAMIGGFLGTLAFGVVLFLFQFAPRVLAVLCTLWVVLACIVALSSPFAWKVVFEILVPMMFGGSAAGVEARRDADGKLVGYKDLTEPDSKTQYLKQGDTK